MDSRTAQALIRFGLGRRAGEAEPSDPVAWLRGQIVQPDPVLAEPWPTLMEALAAIREDRKASQGMRDSSIAHAAALFEPTMHRLARFPVVSQTPFRERLVWFWINHFAISLRAHAEIGTLLLCFVQEAIRPHVTGRFQDMLGAVMAHPAMLLYLDNISSVGPNSLDGRGQHLGLNENLARESLELHTVTQAAGYTQRDIVEYAKILTGWTFNPDWPDPRTRLVFRRHEPGPKTVMGRTFPEGKPGIDQMLAFLGNHPASFHHIAFKLCRHFVADDPPPAAVARIEDVLHRTGGNLGAASLALVDLPEAWQSLTKFRNSADFVWATLRGLGLDDIDRNILASDLAILGQPLLNPDFPNGYPDTEADWSDGELLLRRADWLFRLVAWHQDGDPADRTRHLLGDLTSDDTMTQVQRAASRRDALTLLFGSPEFQRR